MPAFTPDEMTFQFRIESIIIYISVFKLFYTIQQYHWPKQL